MIVVHPNIDSKNGPSLSNRRMMYAPFNLRSIARWITRYLRKGCTIGAESTMCEINIYVCVGRVPISSDETMDTSKNELPELEDDCFCF